MAMDATVMVNGPNGQREIKFADFPAGYLTPSIELNEIVTAVRLPLWPAGHKSAFVEFSRRHGDFAVVSVASLLEADRAGKITRAAIAIGGLGPAPVRVNTVERALIGNAGSAALFRDASESCRQLDAMGDVHAPVSYRQHLAAVLSRRALEKAHARALRADR